MGYPAYSSNRPLFKTGLYDTQNQDPMPYLRDFRQQAVTAPPDTGVMSGPASYANPAAPSGELMRPLWRLDRDGPVDNPAGHQVPEGDAAGDDWASRLVNDWLAQAGGFVKSGGDAHTGWVLPRQAKIGGKTYAAGTNMDALRSDLEKRAYALGPDGAAQALDPSGRTSGGYAKVQFDNGQELNSHQAVEKSQLAQGHPWAIAREQQRRQNLQNWTTPHQRATAAVAERKQQQQADREFGLMKSRQTPGTGQAFQMNDGRMGMAIPSQYGGGIAIGGGTKPGEIQKAYQAGMNKHLAAEGSQAQGLGYQQAGQYDQKNARGIAGQDFIRNYAETFKPKQPAVASGSGGMDPAPKAPAVPTQRPAQPVQSRPIQDGLAKMPNSAGTPAQTPQEFFGNQTMLGLQKPSGARQPDPAARQGLGTSLMQSSPSDPFASVTPKPKPRPQKGPGLGF